MATLNIPMKLMKRYRKDKSLWELFVFAVCLKCLKGSSGIHPDVMKIRHLMKCSHNKAKRMIERAKRCGELFYYNERKNFLVAKTFTHGKLNKTMWQGEAMYSAYCYKFEYEPQPVVSHFSISQTLRDRLILCAMNAKQRKNDFLIVANNSTRSERAKALSALKLSKIAGVHHTTATRHINKMERKGIVNVKRHDFIKVADWHSGEQLTDNAELLSRQAFLRQGYLVVKDCNEYRLCGAYGGRFTNIIFNHKKRHKRNYSRLDIALAHYDN